MPPGGVPDAVDDRLDRLRRAPDHGITLIALAPTTTTATTTVEYDVRSDPVGWGRLLASGVRSR